MLTSIISFCLKNFLGLDVHLGDNVAVVCLKLLDIIQDGSREDDLQQ